MAAVVHHLGQLQHMRLHASMDVERVRAHHADAHQVDPPIPRSLRSCPPASFARRSSDRSASHWGCIMCQSAGCAEMLPAKWSASFCVMTVTSPEDVSSGGVTLN